MARWTLRRFLGRLALASLPALGGCSCSGSIPAQDPDLLVPPDQAVLVASDMAAVDLEQGDLVCRLPRTICQWFAYVDAGADAGNLGSMYNWSPDAGGEEPCAPCRFDALNNLPCGYCVLTPVRCGVAWSCELNGCVQGCSGVGRRPAGLVAPRFAQSEQRAEWLARAAHLEAASVPAFAQLERELRAHGAPERLLAGARRAREDEIRHARIMADFARAAGARVPAVDAAPIPLRPLDEIALENAVEGCVRESYGAFEVLARSRATREPILAAALAGIAADERRHGDLAWAIDAWARPRLGKEARRRVADARAEAIRGLPGVA
jgi:hypothetical protein